MSAVKWVENEIAKAVKRQERHREMQKKRQDYINKAAEWLREIPYEERISIKDV